MKRTISGRRLILIVFALVMLGLAIWLIPPVATLASLRQVDDYPLYTMHYYGRYEGAISPAEVVGRLGSTARLKHEPPEQQPAWACSLFAALGDEDNMLYGRNFDWEYSPALLLFTDPPDGYAAAAMVDIAYLGFESHARAGALIDLSLVQRRMLLDAPFLPFDGMNECGLAVGMAAVPGSAMPYDPAKETIGSLRAIREVLDHACNVDAAIAVLQSYNVDMRGGPPIHYLIADSTGRSILVEFYRSEMVVIPNQAPWHLATNFLRAAAGADPQGECARYDRINARLTETGGQIATQDALDLLEQVSQPSTQWSIVYGTSSGNINVALGREYDDVHTLRLRIVDD